MLSKDEDVEAFLSGESDAAPDPKRFANIKPFVTRKMKIPESGIW